MRIVAIAAAVSFITGTAAADVTFQSAFRESRIGAGFDAPVIQTSSALGGFASSLYDEYTDASHDPSRPSWARSQQQSSVGSGHIWAVGEEGGYDGYPVGGAGTGSGWNKLNATFSTTAGGWVELDLGLLHAPYGPMNQYFVRLVGDSGTIFNFTPLSFFSGYTTRTFQIDPGTYTFTSYFAAGASGAGTGTGLSRYTLALGVFEGQGGSKSRTLPALVPSPAGFVIFAGIFGRGRRR